MAYVYGLEFVYALPLWFRVYGLSMGSVHQYADINTKISLI